MNTYNTNQSGNTVTTLQANALSHKALGVRLSASMFIGNPRDKVLTGQVSSDNHTEAQRISVRKRIMKGAELNLCASTLAEVRSALDQMSAPWLDGGIRIMPAKTVVDGKIKIEAKIREFQTAVDAFIAAYWQIIDRDRKALNGTFRMEDYPSQYELRAKFAAHLEFLPISTDFRVEGIDESLRDELQADADRLVISRIGEAKRDLMERISVRLGELMAKMGEPIKDGTRLHKSIVENITEACASVRASNFDEDSAIDDLASRIESAVHKLDIESLKKDENARDEARALAENALAEVSSAMSAFCA